MIKKIIVTFFISTSLYAQEAVILNPLSGRINTNNPEFNFIQVNDTIAFFTAMDNLESQESSIYYSIKKDEVWNYRKYAKYNFDENSTGEITFLGREKSIFTFCEQNKKCKLILFNENKFEEISAINHQGHKNTQPHFTNHNGQNVLYFVSDRIGGFGGLDIWLSVVDNDGNFGQPINLGKKINTKFDEITPFFNTTNNRLYFSSNKEGGTGGFDVYFSEGRFNLWNTPQNFHQLNTSLDEMYLTFYNDTTGHLSSNRKGAKFESKEFCCNDIFTFTLTKENQSIKEDKAICACTSVSLYFPNDYPKRSNNKNSKTDYKDIYRSYFILKESYLANNKNLESFFEDDLKNNFNKLNKLLKVILARLDSGESLSILVRGHSSPLYDASYNMDLSVRRIKTLVRYLEHYEEGVLLKHIKSNRLKIIQEPFGEIKSSQKVSDNPKERQLSIYSEEATYSRRIEITLDKDQDP